ncbi:MAG: glycoside hydrolase family 2 protein [Oscillospiraceae bacterium]|nr:glycoside hydrolase family 2 protein [Oscillospiraceae bacterium]
MQKYLLNGEWIMIREQTGEQYTVSVPSDNYTQLLTAGVIKDPYYGTNEKDVQWIGKEKWSYERKFTLTAENMENKNILLSCDSLDTLCEVFVNGKSVGKGENAFIKYEFDIKSFVVEGENTVKITFDPPVEYAERLQKEKPLPKNFNGTDGIAYIRKPACHFGWDWGPSIPLSGIIGDISVLCFNERLTDIEIRQIHENGVVTLEITPVVDGEISVSGTVICPDKTEIPFENKSSITIENPELWWTRELSGKETQPLYTVTASAGGSTVTKKIGLRTITLDRNADKFGGNFCFYLNGTPIFAKGASWIIPDSLIGRCTNDTIDYYLDSAIQANFNMLRIWGGAYYGSDYFYERCDELGLLIWQDFMYACLMYPFYEDDFRENALREAEYNVKRIKHHPSLALWCGNNEIETMFSYMPETLKIVQWYKKFYYEILAELAAKLDPDTPYIPTSPIGSEFRKCVTGDAYGDTHMWNVWHGQKPLKYYRKRMTRFCSEFGLESLPSTDAVRTFAEEKDMGLHTEVFNAHQKCRGGNRKMLFYLFEKFYEPQRFEDMIYCTGLIQKECISDATEHWRRNRGRCNGSLFWQYNDCWQAPSWSSVDYTGKWKPLQYHARKFFEPICISVEDGKRDFKIFGINDTRGDKNAVIVYRLSTLDGKTVYEKEITKTLKALSSVELASDSIGNANRKNVFLSVKMYIDGELVSERVKIFVPDRDLNLQGGTIKKTVTYENNTLTVKLLSPVFCRSVMVDIKDFRTPLSDNYFDLLPNEEKIITVKTDKEYKTDEVTIKSLADIPVKKSKLQAKLYRLKFALEPQNIANWFWYSVN